MRGRLVAAAVVVARGEPAHLPVPPLEAADA